MITKIEAKFKKEFELNTDILCSNMTHFWQTPGFDDKICWTLFSLLTWCADVETYKRKREGDSCISNVVVQLY